MGAVWRPSLFLAGRKQAGAALAKDGIVELAMNRVAPGFVEYTQPKYEQTWREAQETLNILDAISKAGAKFKSLADAWADTTTPHGESMITILARLATIERHLIKARTEEG